METLVDLLKSLIAIPSPTGEEDRLLDDIEGRFAVLPGEKRAAFDVRRTAEGLIVAARETGGTRPLVVLAGHADTVPQQGDPGPRLEGDVLWGLGSSDMKSGLAVMTHLGLDLRWDRLPVRLALVYYRGEEGSFEQNTLGPLLEDAPWLLEAGLAVLLEPTDNQIEMGCLGALNVEVVVPGEPCHSARPWLGRNAVSEAAAWIGRMSRREPQDRVVEGLTYKETAAITRLEAGEARNVIPGKLTANVNLRYAPGRDKDTVVRELVRDLPPNAEWRVVDHAPAGSVDTTAPLYRRFLDVVKCSHRAKQAWTDVARFTARGVPALNFGPGLPEYAHRRDEQVPVANLEAAAHWLRRFLETREP